MFPKTALINNGWDDVGKNTRKFKFENVAVFASRPLNCSVHLSEKRLKQSF